MVRTFSRPKRRGVDAVPAPIEVSYEMLSDNFHLPMFKVAENLGIGATTLKHICRKFGLSEWPYRKIMRLKRLDTPENLELYKSKIRTRGSRDNVEEMEADDAVPGFPCQGDSYHVQTPSNFDDQEELDIGRISDRQTTGFVEESREKDICLETIGFVQKSIIADIPVDSETTGVVQRSTEADILLGCCNGYVQSIGIEGGNGDPDHAVMNVSGVEWDNRCDSWICTRSQTFAEVCHSNSQRLCPPTPRLSPIPYSQQDDDRSGDEHDSSDIDENIESPYLDDELMLCRYSSHGCHYQKSTENDLDSDKAVQFLLNFSFRVDFWGSDDDNNSDEKYNILDSTVLHPFIDPFHNDWFMNRDAKDYSLSGMNTRQPVCLIEISKGFPVSS